MGYSAPRLSLPQAPQNDARGEHAGDVAIGGGRFLLGAEKDEDRFVFDNEQWGHEVDVAPFCIARAPVTQAEFAAFVDDGGYQQPHLWQEAGWRWRESLQIEQPMHWRRHSDGAHWQRRHFDGWVSLEAHQPVIHVCWHEAQAYCRWAGRRLPSELEWEVAAAAEPGSDGRIVTGRKRHYPWGETEPCPKTVNMDLAAMGCLDVAAHAAGDSAYGCRQMLGNVWEWTDDTFAPYPGFAPGPYKEYSAPLFGDTKVLRGGCWATRSRLIRNTWRNYYEPHRRDVWAGLRTCAC
jgi:iron(II)-dependent oxidoreductase